MDGPRPEHNLYRIQGRRNTDTATYSLISTVTLTTQVQRPLIIVRHPNESVSDYVWWRYCKHLRYVEDDNRLWRLLSYGTWHHRLVKVYQKKRSSISDEGTLQSHNRENVKPCNSDYSIFFLYFLLFLLLFTIWLLSFLSADSFSIFVNILFICLLIRGSFNAAVSVGRIILV